MEPNDYRRFPRDARSNPFEKYDFDDYDNWDQPEDDILGADGFSLNDELKNKEYQKPEREIRKKKRKGSRIIIENVFPVVDEEESEPSRSQPQPVHLDPIPHQPIFHEPLSREPLSPFSEFPADSRVEIPVLLDDDLSLEEEIRKQVVPQEPVPEDETLAIFPPRVKNVPAPEKAEPTDEQTAPLRLTFEGQTPILEVRNLDVRFGEINVLRDIHFEVKKGETVAIIGESGCGKTVLLKTLIGLIPPSRGEVFFDGSNLNTVPNRELTRLRTRYGFVFQQAALFDSMSIGENISFPLRQHTRLSESEMREIVVQLLGEVGLPKSVIEKKPAELSGGMRKRVGFARALAMEPEVMLYDEPTTGLDPIMSDVINELMLSAKRNHRMSAVLVTHDLKSAIKVADRIIMLYPLTRLKKDEPQIIFDGTTKQIEQSWDPRVAQFLQGKAGERVVEG